MLRKPTKWAFAPLVSTLLYGIIGTPCNIPRLEGSRKYTVYRAEVRDCVGIRDSGLNLRKTRKLTSTYDFSGESSMNLVDFFMKGNQKCLLIKKCLNVSNSLFFWVKLKFNELEWNSEWRFQGKKLTSIFNTLQSWLFLNLMRCWSKLDGKTFSIYNIV